MNEQRLKNIWNRLTADGKTTSDFETWMSNISNNPNVQMNVHTYLVEQKLTQNDFDTWSTNTGLKKKDESEVSPSISQMESTESITEEPDMSSGQESGEKITGIERAFGKNFITDFFGDIYRAYELGDAQGDTIGDALNLFASGAGADEEDIASYLEAVQRMDSMGASDEMKAMQKEMEENGGGVWGFIQAIAKNPSVAPQVFVSSVKGMVDDDAIKTGIVTGLGGAAVSGGTLALPGFLLGASGALETAMSFTEFLKEEVQKKGLEFGDEGVRAVLQDPKALNRIRARAAGRGLVIGGVDAISGGIAGKLLGAPAKVGTQLSKLQKVVPKSSLGKIATAGVIEGTGGGVGEAAARGVVGQEMDALEIGLEAVGGGPVTVAQATSEITGIDPIRGSMNLVEGGMKRILPGQYKINGEVRTKQDVLNILESNDPQAIAGAKLEITNDPELKARFENAKRDVAATKKAEQFIPENIQGEDRARLIQIEKDLSALKGKDSSVAKTRVKVLEQEMSSILDKYKETETTTIEFTDEFVVEKLKEEGNTNPSPEDIAKKKQELIVEQEKIIENANQEQSPDEVSGEGESTTTEGVVDEVQNESVDTTRKGGEETNINENEEISSDVDTEEGGTENVAGTSVYDSNVENNNEVNERGLVDQFLDTRFGKLFDFREGTTKRQKFIDKYTKLRKLQRDREERTGKKTKDEQNFDQAEKLLYGKTRNKLDNFEKQYTDVMGEAKGTGLTIQDISDFLYAQHAKERNSHIKNKNPDDEVGSGMTDKQADEILGKYKGKQKEAIESITKKFQAIQRETLDILYNGGLLTETEYNSLKNNFENYVPLTGFEVDRENNPDYNPLYESNNSLAVKGGETRKALGRGGVKAANILANIIQARTRAVMRVEKNAVLLKLKNFVSDNPESGAIIITEQNLPTTRREIDGQVVDVVMSMPELRRSKDYVRVKDNGKESFIKFADNTLNEILNDAGPAKLGEVGTFIQKYANVLNNWFRVMYTTGDPNFIATNYVRDLQTGLINALGDSNVDIKDFPSFVKRIAKNSAQSLKTITQMERGKTAGVDPEFQQFYREFVEDGGKTGYIYMKDMSDIEAELTQLTDMKPGATTKIKRAVFNNAVTKTGQALNAAAENATRLAAYIEARKQGLSRDQAAALAKDLTVNFNQTGTFGPLLNSLYLFMNAGIQGSDRFVSAMKTKQGKQSAAGIFLGALALASLNEQMSDEDEDGETFYSKIPDAVKERNLIIMKQNGRDYYKIPMPYGYSLFANLGQVSHEYMNEEADLPDVTGKSIRSLIGAFSPINFGKSKSIGGTMFRTAAPQVLKPIADLTLNENFFGSQIYSEGYPGETVPDSERGYATTPDTYKAISKWLNSTFGGSELVSSGPITDFTPETTQYLADQYLLGSGPFKFMTDVINLSKSGLNIGDNEEITVSDKPIIKRFSGEQSRFVDQGIYYDNRQKVRALAKEFEGIKQGGENREKYKAYVAAERLLKLSKSIDKKLKRLRDTKKKLYKYKPDINFEVYNDNIKSIEQAEDQLFDEFNKTYNAYFKKYSSVVDPEVTFD